MALFDYKDLSTLSDIDLTIYRYINSNSEKVIYMRVRDIAQNAHVSNSSVMRFVHKMGFSSFPEMKAYLQNITNHESLMPPLKFIDESNFPKDISNRLQIVTDLLFQADNIILFGIGSSGFLAKYGARQLASIGFNSSSVTDPFYPLESRLQNTSNTVLLCISNSGTTSEVLGFLNGVVNNDDVKIVAITGNETSPLALMSDYSLCYVEPDYRIHYYFDLSSKMPTLYLIEALIHILYARIDK